MKEREVQDSNNTKWKCVQAFAGTNGEASKDAMKLAERNGKVEVVCTPSGGEQTVRIKLEKDWIDQVTDEDLLRYISENKNNS